MRVFLYVVVRDYGFAPNPFHGVCTLATCKPQIRRMAAIGDYVIGYGSKTRGQQGQAVYVMRVDETLNFDAYWADPRFGVKRPVLNGSRKMIFGDNIYHRGRRGSWIQADSHHSLASGRPDAANIKWDTSVDRVLMGRRFSYWGSIPEPLPAGLAGAQPARGHRLLDSHLLAEFIEWEGKNGSLGYLNDPASFERR